MKIHPNVAVLEIPVDFGQGPTKLNLAAIFDPEYGTTLVDTGMPGQEHLILQALEEEGVQVEDVKQIVITHADGDHIGSMKALKELTGAKIICLDKEAGYVSGSVPPYKSPPPERLAENPKLKAFIESVKRLAPDLILKDGETIPGAAGAKVVATPGHTPGHISIYLPEARILITGDALTAQNGRLNGPMPMATPDMPTANASVKKLAELDVEQIIAYHGGLVRDDAGGQLRQLASKGT